MNVHVFIKYKMHIANNKTAPFTSTSNVFGTSPKRWILLWHIHSYPLALKVPTLHIKLHMFEAAWALWSVSWLHTTVSHAYMTHNAWLHVMSRCMFVICLLFQNNQFLSCSINSSQMLCTLLHWNAIFFTFILITRQVNIKLLI